MYVAETFDGLTGSTPDTILGQYDSLGTLIQTDDDSGVGLLSQLIVTVPANGTLFLGVTGFSDFDLIGRHDDSGSYSLSLQAVPEPTGICLGLFGVIVFFVARRQFSVESRSTS